MTDDTIKGYICSVCKEGTHLVRSFDEKRKKTFVTCEKCHEGEIISEVIPLCECGSANLNYDEKRAEVSCKDCGLVLACAPHYVGGDMLVKGAWDKGVDF